MPFMAVGSRIEGAERPRPFVHRQLVRMQHAWLMICGDTLKNHELREHVDPPRPLARRAPPGQAIVFLSSRSTYLRAACVIANRHGNGPPNVSSRSSHSF